MGSSAAAGMRVGGSAGVQPLGDQYYKGNKPVLKKRKIILNVKCRSKHKVILDVGCRSKKEDDSECHSTS